jgi:hypothetical protein
MTLTATDNPGGFGVYTITFRTSGAQTTAETSVTGASASLPVAAEGTTTVTYYATDKAGNVESAKSLVIKLDKTPPEAYLQFDRTTRDVFLFGRDALSGVAPGPVAPASLIAVVWEIALAPPDEAFPLGPPQP